MNFWSCRAVTEAVREDVRAWKHGVGGTAASEGRVGARVKGGASHLNQMLSPKEMTERREASWSLPSGGLALGRVKVRRCILVWLRSGAGSFLFFRFRICSSMWFTIKPACGLDCKKHRK